MLKIFLDDSGMGQPPAYVLAGWVANAKIWAAFSDEWQEILDMKPRLEYLKMKEAQNLSGQFLDWSEVRRNERLDLFMAIMQRYDFLGIGAIVRHEVYEKVFAQIADKKYQRPSKGIAAEELALLNQKYEMRRMFSPYFCAFYELISNLAEALRKYNFGPRRYYFGYSTWANGRNSFGLGLVFARQQGPERNSYLGLIRLFKMTRQYCHCRPQICMHGIFVAAARTNYSDGHVAITRER